MTTEVHSHIVPAGKNKWFILEDNFFKGGLRTIPSLWRWSSVPLESRKSGAFVMTEDTHKLYVIDHDLVHLTEFRLPAARARATLVYETRELGYGDKEDFVLPMAMSNTVYRLEVTDDCYVEAFGTPDMDEPNPYLFYAKGEGVRRVDVGFTYLEDGTVSRNNKYFRLTNTETPPKEAIYFRITCKRESTDRQTIRMSILFYPEEY